MNWVGVNLICLVPPTKQRVWEWDFRGHFGSDQLVFLAYILVRFGVPSEFYGVIEGIKR